MRTSLGAFGAAGTGVTPGQIAGAGAAGLDVLEAATPAQVRSASGVQDGPRDVPVFAYATASSEFATVVAYVGFTPGDHAVTGRTTGLALAAVGNVTAEGLTGTLNVLDSEDTVIATLSWTETARTVKQVTVPLPEGAVVCRARVSCTGADPEDATQFAQFGGCVFRLTWS